MKILQKNKNKDFKILNLSDPQMTSRDWTDKKYNGIMTDLVDELVARERPDLITVSGDLNVSGDDEGYIKFAELIDSYNIPWAFVWGNHDDQGGNEPVERILARFEKCKNLIYERGDIAYGNGNYVIGINEGDTPITALFMLDSHDRADYVDEKGEHHNVWAKLWDNQLEWLKNESEKLKCMGYKDSAIILHIPIFAYIEAFKTAFSGVCPAKDVDPQKSADSEYWNEGYKDSFGVMREGICCYPADDGVFEILKELDFTKHVLCGHDHVNNYSILYKGIRLSYSLKAGIGCYSDRDLLGGTYMTISSEGIKNIYHSYFNADKYLKEE